MRKLARAAIGLAAAAIFSPCFVPPSEAAVKQPKKVFAEPREEQALVYMVRRGFAGGARSMFVYGDRQLLTVLDGSCYGFAHVDPGELLLWRVIARETTGKRVALEAGKTYYFDLGTGAIDKIDKDSGPRFLEKVNAYCQPGEKEAQTADKHVKKHLAEAERRADDRTQYILGHAKRRSNLEAWEAIDLGSYSVLCVEDFEVSDPKAGGRKNSVLVDSAPKRMADRVVEAVEPDLFDQVVRSPMTEPMPGTLVLKGDLTRYKPGSKFGRALMPVTSSANLDFTVSLLDAETDKELTRFSGTWTWKVGSSGVVDVGIEDLERNVAYEIALYLKKCKEVG